MILHDQTDSEQKQEREQPYRESGHTVLHLISRDFAGSQ